MTSRQQFFLLGLSNTSVVIPLPSYGFTTFYSFPFTQKNLNFCWGTHFYQQRSAYQGKQRLLLVPGDSSLIFPVNDCIRNCKVIIFVPMGPKGYFTRDLWELPDPHCVFSWLWMRESRVLISTLTLASRHSIPRGEKVLGQIRNCGRQSKRRQSKVISSRSYWAPGSSSLMPVNLWNSSYVNQ